MAYSKDREYQQDSDADDEYERSVIHSPTLPMDYDEVSPTDSGPMSTEHTPTTFTHSRDSKGSPTGLITEWTAEQTADFISDLGLERYADTFVGRWPAEFGSRAANWECVQNRESREMLW